MVGFDRYKVRTEGKNTSFPTWSRWFWKTQHILFLQSHGEVADTLGLYLTWISQYEKNLLNPKAKAVTEQTG